MHRPETWQDQVDAVEGRVDLGDPRISVVGRGLGWRARPVDLPCAGYPGGRVLREQIVQDRRAGAALPDDDDRRHDINRAALGMRAAIGDDLQTVTEVAGELSDDDRLPEFAQPGLCLQRVDQSREAFLPRVVAEIGKGGLLARLFSELLRI